MQPIIWITRIPRTGTTHLNSTLSRASSENNWKLFKKDHYNNQVADHLPQFDTIYTGHASSYSDKLNDWGCIKLLLTRKDVLGRFVSSYNYSNHLLTKAGKNTLDIDEYTKFHIKWNSEFSNKIKEKCGTTWNPFSTTERFLNTNQRRNNNPLIHNFQDFFNKVYFTESINDLMHDLEHTYGYKLQYHSDWDTTDKNSSENLLKADRLKKTDLTESQLSNIFELPAIREEYEFISIMEKKANNDQAL